MTLNFKVNTSEPNRLTRTFEGETKTMQGHLRAPASVLTPSITVEDGASLAGYNYLEIPDFGRSYYITGLTAISNNLWQVDARVDVLGTYADTIKNSSGIIERRSEGYNAYIDDGALWSEDRTIRTVHHFKGDDAYDVDENGYVFIEPDNFEYILIIGGPGAPQPSE